MAGPSLILWLAFGLGALVGASGSRSHFCTMGAMADIVNMGDWNRMRMWFLAMGVAILGTAGLQLAGLIDITQSIYAGPRLPWLSHVVGGLTFGAGMVLASGCGAKTLIRIGGGSLKSLVVFLVMGLTASITLRGLLGVGRAAWLDPANLYLDAGRQDLPGLLAAATGLPPATALAGLAGSIGLALCLAALARQDFRTRDNLLGGLGVGLAVIGGWYVSGHLGFVPEDPDTLQPAFLATNSGRMESLSFVAPLAYTLDLLMSWSDTSRKLSFGIATALGVVAGSLAEALMSRRFRWEGFRDTEDTASHLIGATLMGFGGVTALGCSIGQGVTGLSTLALGSILTLAAILAGAWTALKIQYWRLLRE